MYGSIKLPSTPGVYYFHDNKAKVVYVGKAMDIRKRVSSSHFSNNKPGKQKQEFLRDIHHITFRECGTELISFILEAVEIKRLWPTFVLLDEGRNRNEKSCILMEQGQFYGMGYIPRDCIFGDILWLKNQLTPYPANDYIRNLIQNYALRFPEKLMTV